MPNSAQRNALPTFDSDVAHVLSVGAAPSQRPTGLLSASPCQMFMTACVRGGPCVP
jgi:hypothetical protein